MRPQWRHLRFRSGGTAGGARRPLRIWSASAPHPQSVAEGAPRGSPSRSGAPALHAHRKNRGRSTRIPLRIWSASAPSLQGSKGRSTKIPLRIWSASAPHLQGEARSASRESPSGSGAPSLHTNRGLQGRPVYSAPGGLQPQTYILIALHPLMACFLNTIMNFRSN